MKTFYEELSELINKHSVENDSNTPDFMLAKYITNCLKAYNTVIHERDKWYGFKPWADIIPKNPEKDK